MKKPLLLACIILLLATVGNALGALHAFIWDAVNGPRDLGTLGGDCWATAINDSGTVVGVYVPLNSNYHAFIWTEATGMVDLGIPGGGDSRTAVCYATAINSAGNVAGYGRQVDGRQVAFFWSPTAGFTVFTDFSSNADNGNTAYAINDLDQVTGNFLVSDHGFTYHAYLWSPNMIHPHDLGVIDGAQYSLGNGINNLREIVGGSLDLAESWQPMSWTRRTGMRLLGVIEGSLYAQALAINDAGQIIGLDQTGTADLAFYTDRNTGLRFLKGLGGNTTYAEAINQQGVIVGVARDTTLTDHAVMWSTPQSVPQVIPLGAAYALNNLGQVAGYGPAP